MFSIRFVEDLSNSEAVGKITLNNEAEYFRSPIGYWRKEHYQRAWKKAERKILSGEADFGVLPTSILDPTKANFFSVWVIYREEDFVFAQSRILMLRGLKGVIPNHLDDMIGPRITITPEGDRVSEWKLSLEEIRADFQTRR